MSASPTRQATVEDATSASPTPTPPPASDFPESSSTQVDKVEDQPMNSLGDDEGEEEWDPSSERLPGQSSPTSKEKDFAVEDENHKEEEGKEKEQPWQAVWAAEQNAWYFWNKDTGEVTWTNPLEPSSSSASTQPPLPTEQPPTAAASSSSINPGLNNNDNGYGFGFGFGDPSQPEIDPGLAHLFGGDSSGPGGLGGDPTMQKAMFNSRTGRFTASNYEYTVGHLDEYNRAKRMNSHYFDVDQWEREKQQENEKKRKALEDGKGGEKKITKKDMERFRKKNAEKKARSQAWLRE
ncbi:hypothetical protein I203_104782 [Kwoniella mangroviensis CBS 8507]|uniref:uncharacterized protein n=1 Tax=Kwoniella mangroviensis CBS 8507 TaxID=1296122 RepID=UPI00080D156F|nr:uncharacterized protein I203_00275 [Kwoniella mangroviensis CBS 8507]OCF70143.1 hypothetical protein I203_00275 [Kwoniella mangroviensis CBS 8507]